MYFGDMTFTVLFSFPDNKMLRIKISFQLFKKDNSGYQSKRNPGIAHL